MNEPVHTEFYADHKDKTVLSEIIINYCAAEVFNRDTYEFERKLKEELCRFFIKDVNVICCRTLNPEKSYIDMCYDDKETHKWRCNNSKFDGYDPNYNKTLEIYTWVLKEWNKEYHTSNEKTVIVLSYGDQFAKIDHSAGSMPFKVNNVFDAEQFPNLMKAKEYWSHFKEEMKICKFEITAEAVPFRGL